MSGLIKLVKKVFKPIKEAVKKVFKSKVFKVVAIAAAVVFTGGAALGALGAAGAGGGLMASLSAGFQGGLAALGSAGSAIWTGVKAAGSAVKGFLTGSGGAATQTATTTIANPAAAGLTAGQAAALNIPTTLAPVTQAATGGGLLGNPLAQAAMVQTTGSMIGGYAQGRAQEEQINQIQDDRLSRDRYGYDGHGNKTGELINPSERLAAMHENSAQRRAATLDAAPAISRPAVAAPTTELETAMRNRLMASLDSLRPAAAF